MAAVGGQGRFDRLHRLHSLRRGAVTAVDRVSRDLFLAQRFGPRSGHWYGPEPKTGQEALELRDRLLTWTQRLWMANRGVWEALPGAGPTLAVPASAADVERYLDAYTSFLRAVAS